MYQVKKNIFLIISVLFLIPTSSPAQTSAFSKHSGSTTNDYATRIAIDAEGNSYVLGEYTGTATFDTIIVQNQGKWNAILAKYNPSGNIIWAKTLAYTKDPLSDLYANALRIDRSGNIYIGGKFVVDVTISDITFSCNGASDMYLAKFSKDGSLLWAKQAGGVGQGSYGQDEIHALALDTNGNCYIAGTYNQDAKFDTISLSSPNTMEAFIAKYDSSGNAIWATSGGENGINHTATSIEVDQSGNSYITGIFYEKLSLGDDTLDAVDAEQKIFLAKADPKGKFIWAKKVGSGGYYGGARDMKIDSLGNCYLAGYFRAGIHIGSQDISYSNGLMYAALILKYDMDGNFLWVEKTDGNNQNTTASGIALDAKNNIFITGSCNGSVSFGTTTMTNNQSIGMGFAAVLNSDGNFHWAKPMDGYGHISGTNIATTTSGDCIVIGTFDSTLSLGTNILKSDGGSDVFVAKLDLNENGVVDQYNDDPENLVLFPNPAIDHLNLSNTSIDDIKIFTLTGVPIQCQKHINELDVSGLSHGSYVLMNGGRQYKFNKE